MSRAISLLFVALSCLCWACSPAKPARISAPGPVTAPAASEALAPAPVEVQDLRDVGSSDRPEQAQSKVPVSSADPQWGNVDAPVTIVEFTDFQCPFCGRVVATLSQLQSKYGPTQLRIVYKHLPLPFHQDARPTAETAAAVQLLAGSAAFIKFHDLAFAHQQELTQDNREAWASQLGIDPSRLRRMLESGLPAKKVDEDLALAPRVDALGTPAFLINGVKVSGAQPLDKFVEVVDAQLAAARTLTQSGTPPRLIYSTLTDKNFKTPPPRAPEKDDEEDDKTVWNVPVGADDPVQGAADALVTIVEFSDYQCPFCKRVEATLTELRRIYGKDLRLVWKDNPLPFHQRAMPAAKLARAVFQKKGSAAFWKLHDAIFESNPKLEDSDFEELVKKQGLDWKALSSAAAAPKIADQIDASIGQADDYQARGTPHFFINGQRLSGAQPVDAFRKVIDEQLLKAQALVTSGTPRAKVYAALTKDGKTPPEPEKKHIDLRASAAARGLLKAPVVIQEFSDFQCPFCKRVEPTLAQLEKEFGGQLRVVWRHLPLPFHQHAQLAAEAAEEVLAQKGEQAFWKFHDALFEAQGVDGGLERPHLEELAAEQGLDMARFTAALDNRTHQAQVEADATIANSAGINGTPAFLINDYFVSGAQAPAVFRRVIKRALSDVKSPKAGKKP